MDSNLGQVVLVRDIVPGKRSSYPSNFIEFADRLYFTANNGENGEELWVSDGTSSGTQLLVDIYPGVSYFYPPGTDGVYNPDSLYSLANSSYPNNFVEFENKLYFSANDGENGGERWVTDGTAEGTRLATNINFGSNAFGIPNSSYPEDFAEFEDRLYFSADDGENGEELWVSDGTAEGTQLLLDINPGTNYYSYDYNSYSANRSSPGNFIEFNDKLYFTANNGETGNELWVTDGTAEGTQMLLDIYPGNGYSRANSSFPSEFVEFNDKLYFTANNGESGNELWVTDGTAEGTQLAADINLEIDTYGNSFSSSPRHLTIVGDELFFSADNGETGQELFKLTVPDSVVTVGVKIDNDTLDYGTGADVFPLEPGENVIVDFQPGRDRFVLGGGLSFSQLSFKQDSILVGDETLAILPNFDAESLTESDFNMDL